MAYWWNSTVENNIRTILGSLYYRRNPNHHLGRPFLTAYQLAIEYHCRFGNLPGQPSLPIGGRGVQVHRSMAQQLARKLSQRIHSGELRDIEGGFLSELHRNDISFNSPYGLVNSSVADISIFRLIDDKSIG